MMQRSAFAAASSYPALRQLPAGRLFFAVLPPADKADQITRRAYAWREQHRLASMPLPAGHLHITVLFLGEYASLAPQTLANANTAAAAAAAATAPFDVRFDRIANFKAWRSGRGQPLVLLGEARDMDALHRFRSRLSDAWALPPPARETSFIPHLTLLYDRQPVAPSVIAPVQWTVHELVLLYSLSGQKKYEVLGRWPLRPL